MIGNGIINISGIDLSQEKIRTLDRGLKFAPKKNFNKFNAYVDIQEFTRKLQ